MRLSKIQKFLKENNIDYTYSSDKYSNNEFGRIDIKSNKTRFTSISEMTGNRGSSVSGIMAFFTEKISNRKTSAVFSSQQDIINRIKADL